ncbi:hypothetical protein [Streptomyces lomondensis]|uniref:Uncharacterized protein n=1 Tax=Streptomyces lomondensis TaxID=68229 RepID=A0ABQ2X0A4_9ACTN|nr:hypothetical protein [Streptomyces lomondensis]MCF0076091.1 hypothetical protein [Streptomyces lomondensis]GGW88870.1 hypothetical protein GCM10010383_17620 [Streptomyces lomondensis]
MWLPRFLLHALLARAARDSMRVYPLHDLLTRAARDHGTRDHTQTILDWSARQEERRRHDRALTGYRVAAGQGRNHVDLRLTATEGIHRVLRAMAADGPAKPALIESELSRARLDLAEAHLARARHLRARGDLAEARRAFQALIDERVGTVSGRAAHELAEMIDDARGNRREERFPPEPVRPTQPWLGQDPVLVRDLSADDTKARPDPSRDLPALGYTTESEALADAIALCRTALRLGTAITRTGVSALLAQLLEDQGDLAGAAVALAHLDIPALLNEAADASRYFGGGRFERDSDHSRPTLAELCAPRLVASLRPTEVVRHVRPSSLRRPLEPDHWQRGGFLALTDERLLFVDGDTAPPDGPELAIDRRSVLGVSPPRQDEHGRTWLDIRSSEEGEVSVGVDEVPDAWLTALHSR